MVLSIGMLSERMDNEDAWRFAPTSAKGVGAVAIGVSSLAVFPASKGSGTVPNEQPASRKVVHRLVALWDVCCCISEGKSTHSYLIDGKKAVRIRFIPLLLLVLLCEVFIMLGYSVLLFVEICLLLWIMPIDFSLMTWTYRDRRTNALSFDWKRKKGWLLKWEVSPWLFLFTQKGDKEVVWTFLTKIWCRIISLLNSIFTFLFGRFLPFHRSCSSLHSLFKAPKRLKNKGKSWIS